MKIQKQKCLEFFVGSQLTVVDLESSLKIKSNLETLQTKN